MVPPTARTSPPADPAPRLLRAVGMETQASFTDTKENRGDFEDSVVLGPSFQYRPYPQMTVNFAPLFGVTEDSPVAQVWFNAGWEF